MKALTGADGEIAVTRDVTLDWGQPLQPWDRYQPIRLGLSDDRMLFGGLLPPGAVSIEAVEATGVRKAAAVGGGTYAVPFEDGEHSEPALAYRDAAGAFVHRPMPAEYPHQPVNDAQEPCPVYGAAQYDEYFLTLTCFCFVAANREASIRLPLAAEGSPRRRTGVSNGIPQRTPRSNRRSEIGPRRRRTTGRLA